MRGKYEFLDRDLPMGEKLLVERRRLRDGVGADEKILGLEISSFVVQCNGDAPLILERAKQLMQLVNVQCLAERWPSDEEWPGLLPEWFVENCSPERTEEEKKRDMAKWFSLPYEERWKLPEEKWSPLQWIRWMEPDEREWLWWDGEVRDKNTLIIDVDQVYETRYADLHWLFRGCGAEHVEEPDIEDMIGVIM